MSQLLHQHCVHPGLEGQPPEHEKQVSITLAIQQIGSALAVQATMATEVTWQPSRGRLRKPCFSETLLLLTPIYDSMLLAPPGPTLTPSFLSPTVPYASAHQPDTPAWPHHSPLELQTGVKDTKA